MNITFVLSDAYYRNMKGDERMVKMEVDEIENKIEELRETLNNLSANRTSNKMVSLSQELDSHIVAYQKALLKDNGFSAVKKVRGVLS